MDTLGFSAEDYKVRGGSCFVNLHLGAWLIPENVVLKRDPQTRTSSSIWQLA